MRRWLQFLNANISNRHISQSINSSKQRHMIAILIIFYIFSNVSYGFYFQCNSDYSIPLIDLHPPTLGLRYNFRIICSYMGRWRASGLPAISPQMLQLLREESSSLGDSWRPELFIASVPYLRYVKFSQIAFGPLPRHTLWPLLSEVLWSRGFASKLELVSLWHKKNPCLLLNH